MYFLSLQVIKYKLLILAKNRIIIKNLPNLIKLIF